MPHADRTGPAAVRPIFKSAILLLPLLCAPAAVQAAGEWRAADSEATIALPDPAREGSLGAATMRCAEQQWSLGFSVDGAIPSAPLRAELIVGVQSFATQAAVEDGLIIASVPQDAIAPLKGGSRLDVRVASGSPDVTETLGASYSLRGSRRAIEAAEPLCSARDMSAYQRVALSEMSPVVHLARELRAGEINVFTTATSSDPRLAAEIVELDGGRRLLFAEICGSSWYYGRSGCNLSAFALPGPDGQWTLVYDAEGADIYLDRDAATDGWPDVIANPRRGGGEPVVWQWSAAGYVLKAAADEAAAAPAE